MKNGTRDTGTDLRISQRKPINLQNSTRFQKTPDRRIRQVSSRQVTEQTVTQAGALFGDRQTENENLQAKLFISDTTSYTFPEQKIESLMSRANTGICFSGGGTRSLTATMGQLRGLNQLGLLEKIRYISSVSGGSWAASTYTYFCNGPETDEEFLGPMTEPTHITMEGLQEPLPETCLGSTATSNFLSKLFCLLLGGFEGLIQSESVWLRAVGETFFKPFGLYDPCNPAYFSLDEETVQDIQTRNPGLAEAPFHTVRPDRPYLIINSAIIRPASLKIVLNEQLTGCEYTPLSVGSPHGVTIKYEFLTCKKQLGGGFVEPFAFGGHAPLAQPDKRGQVKLPKPETPFTIAAASGTSSCAPAKVLADMLGGLEGVVEKLSHTLEDFLEHLEIEPQLPYWPVTDGEPVQATDYRFGDGGNIENLGIIPLLLRKVETIVVFVNTDTKLNMEYDPEKDPGLHDLDPYIAPLFGYELKVTGADEHHNQVFAKQEFAKLVQGLQSAKAAGTTVMTTTELLVQKNEVWGVEGGWPVTVCWVYNERVDEWEEHLPGDLRAEISKGNSATKPNGMFKHFPNYLTMFENCKQASLIQLTNAQVKLLADLSCWNVTANAEHFKRLL